MAMMTEGAAPCLNPKCGTTGGSADRDRNRPRRTRGLCHACYQRAWLYDCLDNYENIPDPWPIHPKPWPHLNDVAATGHMLWHDAEGRKTHHAVRADGYDAARTVRQAQQDAARWLTKTPTLPLIWEHPEFALFGAANALKAA